MPDESEVIYQQMRETRSALAEKLETLENQVVDTVSGANMAVTDTVENVKEAVQETVEAVKESVKNTFDLPAHMDRHPWLFLGGAVAVGYVGGCLMNKAAAHAERRGAVQPAGTAPVERTNGVSPRFPDREERAYYPPPRRAEEPGWLAILGSKFSSEIDQLKSLALGAAVGLVRDALVQSAPEPLRPQLGEVMDDITAKLGGKTIPGPVLGESEYETRAPR